MARLKHCLASTVSPTLVCGTLRHNTSASASPNSPTEERIRFSKCLASPDIPPFSLLRRNLRCTWNSLYTVKQKQHNNLNWKKRLLWNGREVTRLCIKTNKNCRSESEYLNLKYIWASPQNSSIVNYSINLQLTELNEHLMTRMLNTKITTITEYLNFKWY